MARKSRKTVITPDTNIFQPICKVAAYVRLSTEKEQTLARGTIENQANFIKEYIARQEDMELYDIYVDDDITGTTYDRPDFQRMMTDIRRKKINVVIVKDLSRLGRNYVETGELLEMTFPMLNVRVIAITDNYDSDKGAGGLSVAITNMVNDFYAKDISKKIYTAKQSMMQKGIPTGAVPFGYKNAYDENGTRIIVIDDEPAETVKLIFKMFLDGKSTKDIADILNKKGCLTPYQYRYRDRPEKLAERPYLKWTIHRVAAILAQDVYTGKYTLKKREKAYFRNEDIHHNPQDEWLVFEDHHPAIISKEDFDKAAELKKRKLGKNAKHKKPVIKYENLLKGKLFCKCGSAYGNKRNGNTFYCLRKHTYGEEVCNNDNISHYTLYNAVLSVIKEQIDLLLDEDKIIKALNYSSSAMLRKKSLISMQAKKQANIKRLYKLKSELYSDYTADMFTEKEYITLNREYSAQIESIEIELANITRSIQSLEQSSVDSEKIKTIIHKYKNKRKLSQEMVDALISKVIIYDSKNIEVQLNFDDVLQETLAKREERQAVLNG